MLITILVSMAAGSVLGFGSKTLIDRSRRKRAASATALPEDASLMCRIVSLKLPMVAKGRNGGIADLGRYAVSTEKYWQANDEKTDCDYCGGEHRWLLQYVRVPVPDGCRDLGLTRAIGRALFCERCGRIIKTNDWERGASNMFAFIAELERPRLESRNERVSRLMKYASDCETRLATARAELEPLIGKPRELAGAPYRPMLTAKND